MTSQHMQMFRSTIDKYTLSNWKKHGILGCGFEGGYHDGEIFMRYVVMPESLVEQDLNSGECYDVQNLNMVHPHPLASLSVYERIFNMCVGNGFFFESFLDACRETKAMDKWFMSDDFMDSVYAGSIYGRWCIKMQGENGLDSYHERFRTFVRDADERLSWTSAYLKESLWWGNRKVYWE